MKVAILECDSVIPELATEHGSYSSMICNMFNAVTDSLQFTVFDIQQEQYPALVDSYDFYITTGSKAGVYEDLPWIHRLIAFIRRLDQEGRKLIGICFGHQAIAMALGGKVEKSARGWGVGVATNRIVARPDWMQPATDELNIIVSHQDQITRLPEGDTLLVASSDFCPYFVVQWGRHFLSIQGHPEWQRNYSRALMEIRRDRIGDQRTAAGMASLSIEPDNALFTGWILNFILPQS